MLTIHGEHGIAIGGSSPPARGEELPRAPQAPPGAIQALYRCRKHRVARLIDLVAFGETGYTPWNERATQKPIMNHGRLKMTIAVPRTESCVVEQEQAAPLKVARPFPREVAGAAGLEFCVMDASPGLLPGDRYVQTWRLEAGARARVTSQGFTRVHPGRPRESRPDETGEDAGAAEQQWARQRIQLEVAAGARLLYLPGATILFKDAALETSLEAQVEPGGALILLDIVGAGRIARGECFEFAQLDTRLRLHHGVNLALCAQGRVAPAQLDPRDAMAWGAWTHLAWLVLIFDQCEESWAQVARESMAAHPVRGGASRLAHGGIAVSLLAQRAHDAQTAALDIAARWEKLIQEADQKAGHVKALAEKAVAEKAVGSL